VIDTIGKIRRVPLREVWKHEATDLTRWLEGNIDVLSDVTGLSLRNAEREKPTGSFQVDLVAETSEGALVIVENQLERTDHDHLGKVITYMVGLEAKVAIWIAADPRPEHASAINWLNQSSAADFYLLKIEAVKIEESPAAPLLTLIVGPDPAAREIGDVKREFAERHELRYKFWEQLLQRAKTLTRMFSGRRPGNDSYITSGAGMTGLTYYLDIKQHEGFAGLNIDPAGEAENKAIFDSFAAHKVEIEERFGGTLEWRRKDGKIASEVFARISRGGYKNPETDWPEIQDLMLDSMVRFEKAFSPLITALRK